MKLSASAGWIIVRRTEPETTSAGGILLPTAAKPGKIERGTVVASQTLVDGQTVLFKAGEPFTYEGESLLAVKVEDVIGMVPR